MYYEFASNRLGREEFDAIHRCIVDGFSSDGVEVQQCEQAIAARLGRGFAVMTSGTDSASLLAVASLFFRSEGALHKDDEILVSAIVDPEHYRALIQFGLRIRPVEIQPDTLNIDVARLNSVLTSRTRMVIASPAFGNPCDLDELRNFCDAHGIYLLEDLVDSVGARWKDREVGTFGDLAVVGPLSSAIGGSALVTDDEDLYQLALRHRQFLPAFSDATLRLSSAVFAARFAKINPTIAQRRRNAEIWRRCFSSDSRFFLPAEFGVASWPTLPILLAPNLGIDRHRISMELSDHGIGCRWIAGNAVFPYAATAQKYGFTVANHPRDLSSEIQRLWEVLDGAI